MDSAPELTGSVCWVIRGYFMVYFNCQHVRIEAFISHLAGFLFFTELSVQRLDFVLLLFRHAEKLIPFG